MPGSHRPKDFTVPSLTNSRIWFGVPEPRQLDLALLVELLTGSSAAAEMPTVVGEMMPLRLG